MDYAPLSALISDLLSGDRARQHAAITQHVSEDVKFSHILGTIEGRDALLGIYRLCGTVWDYKVTISDYIRSGNTVVLQADLGIKVPPLYIWRYHFPTIVLLRFKEGPDGRPLLAEQVDHHSMLALLWLLGWPFTAVSEQIIRPLEGLFFSRAGWALDAVLDARDAAVGALWRAAGRVLAPAGAALDGAMAANGGDAVRKSL